MKRKLVTKVLTVTVERGTGKILSRVWSKHPEDKPLEEIYQDYLNLVLPDFIEWLKKRKVIPDLPK